MDVRPNFVLKASDGLTLVITAEAEDIRESGSWVVVVSIDGVVVGISALNGRWWFPEETIDIEEEIPSAWLPMERNIINSVILE